MKPVSVIQGTSPVILGMPHVGTYVPEAVAAKLNAEGRRLRDTDWHIDRLYDGLLPGASVVKANFHRYVIDANRDPSGVSLYPGQNTTGLVPQTDFDNQPIWADVPDAAESRAAAGGMACALSRGARGRGRAGQGGAWDCGRL